MYGPGSAFICLRFLTGDVVDGSLSTRKCGMTGRLACEINLIVSQNPYSKKRSFWVIKRCSLKFFDCLRERNYFFFYKLEFLSAVCACWTINKNTILGEKRQIKRITHWRKGKGSFRVLRYSSCDVLKSETENSESSVENYHIGHHWDEVDTNALPVNGCKSAIW